MKKLAGKTALITGASRGIGRAIALKLASEGANIIINYSGSKEKAEEVQKEALAYGVQASIHQCNVGDFAAVGAMIEEGIKAYGNIDILVNNAGITRDTLLMRMSETQFDEVIDINLKGTFNTMQAISKYMIKQRAGRIINISSISGVMGNAGQINYSASKAGVIGMSKSAARELASRNITVNVIAPGFIKTEMTDVLSDKIKESMIEAIPLKRFGEVEDIANAVAFLAGDDAGYITGQVLNINGGMYI